MPQPWSVGGDQFWLDQIVRTLLSKNTFALDDALLSLENNSTILKRLRTLNKAKGSAMDTIDAIKDYAEDAVVVSKINKSRDGVIKYQDIIMGVNSHLNFYDTQHFLMFDDCSEWLLKKSAPGNNRL